MLIYTQEEMNDMYRESERAAIEYQNNLMVTSWHQAMVDMMMSSFNFYAAFKAQIDSINTSTSAAFQYMFTNIGTGWQVLANGMTMIAVGIRDSFIKVVSDMAAHWLMQHVIMQAITLAWKVLEIGAAAAVAAARAAAASAWSLWGAIAIGAAIGLGVMAMANKFASGTENFKGGFALVGEQGPELVNLPRGSNVYRAGETASIINNSRSSNSSMGINVTITGNHIGNDMDLKKITDKVSDAILKSVKLERNI